MLNWETHKIEELFNLVPGFAFKSEEFRESGIPVLKIKNVKANEIILDELSYVDHSYLKTRQDKQVKYGDLLITMSGNRHDGTRGTWVGKVAEFRHCGDFLLNQRMGILRPKPNASINTRCCSYFLSSDLFQDFFIAIATSSGGQANLSPAQIYGAEICLPSQSDQDRIATLLGSLDEKIDLNRRMNETLEASARAIFQSWFIDFAPTHAKAEGRPPQAMSHKIAQLFPDGFDDEGKPTGWNKGMLSKLATSQRESISPANICADTPYVGLEHMSRRTISLNQWESAGKVSSGKTLFNRGEFLFGKLRPYFHKVAIAPVNGICSTDIVVVKAKLPAASAFVLCCISSEEFVAYTDRTSAGTKMPRTSWEMMGRYEICIPTEGPLEAFEQVAAPLFDRIISNIHENRSLNHLRDLLLPKLMSGQVCLKQIERAVEAVL